MTDMTLVVQSKKDTCYVTVSEMPETVVETVAVTSFTLYNVAREIALKSDVDAGDFINLVCEHMKLHHEAWKMMLGVSDADWSE